MFKAMTYAPLLIAVFATALLTGCESNNLTSENDALRTQNQELQSELDAARIAQDAAASDRDRWMQEAQRLQQQLAQQPPKIIVEAPPAPVPVAPVVEPIQPEPTGATGFEDIAGVETMRSGGTVKVRIPGDILFAPGKVDLKPASKSTLSEIAGVIQSQYPAQTVRVEGYTDTDPIRRSKWKDNLELSLQRAASVERYLEERGISSDRMYSAGFGDANPQATKAKSRRVEIVVIEYE